jgi:hypothetical protein
MLMPKFDPQKENVRVALQPDGLYHLVTGRDWLRAFCSLRLKRHELCYMARYRYGADPSHCLRCAAILDRCARFPEKPNEELKPVLERIAKLLALSESPNENEAAMALERANELLAKYNLGRGVVQDSAEQKAEKGASDSLGVNVQPYKYVLAKATAHLHDVEWYRESRQREGGGWRWIYNKYIVFIGLEANVATALVTYPYLVATTEAFARSVRLKVGENRTRDYKQGFADRIAYRVAELKYTICHQPGAADLIRIGNEVATNAMRIESLFLGGGFCVDNGIADREAYQRGYRDGVRVNLHGARTSRMLE